MHDGEGGTDCTGPSVCGHGCSALCCVITGRALDCSFSLKSRDWYVAMTGWRKVAGGPVLLSFVLPEKC